MFNLQPPRHISTPPIFDRHSILAARPASASPRKLTSGPNEKLVAMGPLADMHFGMGRAGGLSRQLSQ